MLPSKFVDVFPIQRVDATCYQTMMQLPYYFVIFKILY
jgi:hypothetical protein